MFGDGVFRTIRVENGEALHLPLHLEKLKKECASLHISYELPDIARYVVQHAQEGVWRLRIAVQAEERLMISKPIRGHVTLSIVPYVPLVHCHKIGIYPEPFHRLNCKIKALSFLDNLSLYTWANEHAWDEVLTTSPEGYILEGAFCNVFWEEEGMRYFVDPSLPYYEGVMQEQIIKESKNVGFAKIKANELRTKKIFLCNALKGIVPASF